MGKPAAPGYVLGLYEKSMPGSLTLLEKLRAARETGYDFLELSIDETEEKLSRLQWTRAERAQAVRDIREAQIPIGSICLSGHRRFPLGHPDPEVRRRSLQIMAGAIDLAAELGVRIIQLAGYDVYYEPPSAQTRAWFGENLGRSVELAARAGVILAFETMETDFLNTVEKAMTWVRSIRSPYLQVYPDTGNLTNAAKQSGTNELEDLSLGRGHLAALHLKESRPGVYREVPYGEGHVDFGGMTRTAYRLGVRRYLAEFWDDGRETWPELLRENNTFLRRYLDAAANEEEMRP